MGHLGADPSGGIQRSKAYIHDYDKYLLTSEDTGLYCLSDRQIAVLLAMIEYTRWRTRWISLSGATISQDDLDDWHAQLQEALMIDHCAEISDALAALQADVTEIDEDVDHIEAAVGDLGTALAAVQTDVTEIDEDVDDLQSSIVTINTNITNIDASLTIVENTVNETINQTTNIIITQNILNLSVALPSFTFTLDRTDSTVTQKYARYNAFCLAVQAWMYSAAYLVDIEQGAPATDLQSFLNMVVANFRGDWTSSVWRPPAPFVAYSSADILAAFGDTTAFNDVACYMISYLQNLAPSLLNFVAALAAYAHGSTTTAHNYIVWATVLNSLDDMAAFAGFSALYDYYYQIALADNPTDFDCISCTTPSGFCTWPYTWDFSIGNLLPWTINRGDLVIGQGIAGKPIAGDANYGLDIQLDWPSGCDLNFVPTSMRSFDLTCAYLGAGGNPFYFQHFWSNAGVITQNGGGAPCGGLGSYPDTTLYVSSMGNTNDPAGNIVRLRISTADAFEGLGSATPTAMIIKSIRIYH
jgi:prefoldin subunit 5